jgi:hypothetical protein
MHIQPEIRWIRLTIGSGLPSRRNVHGYPDEIAKSVADEDGSREHSLSARDLHCQLLLLLVVLRGGIILDAAPSLLPPAAAYASVSSPVIFSAGRFFPPRRRMHIEWSRTAFRAMPHIGSHLRSGRTGVAMRAVPFS